jgi:hypothetical protein
LLEEFLEVFFILGGWEHGLEVGFVLFLSAFKDIAFGGAVDLLESANVSVEVLVRNNEWSSAFRVGSR